MYHYSLELVRQHPLFGVGLGGYSTALAEIAKGDQPFIVFALPYAYHPHNIFLAMWLNMGLLGLVAFVAVLVSFVRMALHPASPPLNVMRRCLLFALLAIIIHGLFDTPYFKNDLSALFWLICAGIYLTTHPTNEPAHSQALQP